MIVVKVELWSAVDGRREEIGRAYLSNDGTHPDPRRGNYDAAVCRRGETDCPWWDGARDATRTGRVEDYPRLSYSVWRLVIRALRACFPEER